MALLMPEGERDKWEGLSHGLSDDYNSPGRLAVFRRRFESAIRRPEEDPATFATELGILAVHGFGDMDKRARDSMIRDRYIAAQWNCRLRRYLDGVSLDAPIRDIVDRCRVWESHSEQEPSSGAGQDQDSLGESDDSWKLGCLRADSQDLMVCSKMDSRVPVPVVGVSSRSVETQRKVGEEAGQLTPLEAISSLVTRLLQTAQEGRLVDEIVPSEGGTGPPSAGSPGTGAERGHSVREWVRVCFSCGRQGHGVNRCSQVDTSFPFLPQGWMSAMANIGRPRSRYQGTTDPGRGIGWWFEEMSADLAVAGGTWTRTWLGFEHTCISTTGECEQNKRKLPDLTEGSLSVVPQLCGARRHGRGMRPARGTRPSPHRVRDELMDEGENTRLVPLSVGAEEFSVRTVCC